MSWNFGYDSPQAIKMVLKAQDMAMCKRFGQNFLIETTIRERIVQALDLEKGMKVWEIGAGLGSITSLLLQSGASVAAFEIDHGFCRILRECAFAGEKGFELVEGDALKTMPSRTDIPDRICGNLPYNVGSVILGNIMEGVWRPQKMVFTLQKEVVQRICATCGSEEWSTISILCQMDYDVKRLFDIKPGSFYPEPNVTSSVLLLERRKEGRVPPLVKRDFIMLMHDLFAQRRKTIKNNLLRGKCGSVLLRQGVDEVLGKSGIAPNRRAEDLSWEELVTLTSLCSRHASSVPSGSR